MILINKSLLNNITKNSKIYLKCNICSNLCDGITI